MSVLLACCLFLVLVEQVEYKYGRKFWILIQHDQYANKCVNLLTKKVAHSISSILELIESKNCNVNYIQLKLLYQLGLGIHQILINENKTFDVPHVVHFICCEVHNCKLERALENRIESNRINRMNSLKNIQIN